MSQSFNSGKVSATITGGAAVTRIVSRVSAANNSGTTTLLTVGAGRKITVIGFTLISSYSAVIAYNSHNGGVTNTTMANTNLMTTYESPLATAAAGQTIQVVTAANTRTAAVVYYVDELA